MSDSNVEIVKISEYENFGAWFEKINEIINTLNVSVGNIKTSQDTISSAESTGQIGAAVVMSGCNDCIHSGLYHINADNTNTNPAMNLYVASTDNCITQIAVTEETPPKISIRTKSSSNSNSSFSNWIELAEKYYTENTFLKSIGGIITGDLSVDASLTTNTFRCSGSSTFDGLVNVRNSTSNLTIKNHGDCVTVDGHVNESPHIAYYVDKENGFVSTDSNGDNVVYYYDSNTKIISNHNIEYYIHTHLNTLNLYNNGVVGSLSYYIQNELDENNCNRVTQTINDNTTTFLKDGVALLDASNNNKQLMYFIVNDDVYGYENQFYTLGNDVYRYSDDTKIYSIEKSEVVEYIPIGIINKETNVVGSLEEPTKIIYYIHNDDGKEYLSLYKENGISKDFFLTEDGVYSDENCHDLVYSINNNVIEQRIVMYYIHTKQDSEGNSYIVWCVDTEGEIPSLYFYENKVILLKQKPTYRVVRYLDTISTDKDGLVTRFYIQKNNNVTSDIDGVQILYIINDDYMASIHTPTLPLFYVWRKDNTSNSTEIKKLITKTPVYYVQQSTTSNNKYPVSSDEEGLNVEFLYEKTNDNPKFDRLLYTIEPIRIDLLTNVCNINGNAITANRLNSCGLTHSFESGETNLAASGKALMDLSNSIQGKYIPFTGGTFTGYVIHSNDIILGKTAKIKAYEKLNFHSQGEISFVVNSDSGKIFIDKHDGVEGIQDGEPIKLPCVFGARTRTGITNAGMGDVLYNLGSIEFTEDNTRIRYRRTNATNVNDIDTVNDISLYLTPTTFHPSVDNVVSLGTAENRFAQIYAVTDNITTSDKTAKTSIKSIDKSLLKAWKSVEWKSYKLKSSVKEKGEAARTHTGLIAQEIRNAISNANDYGFFCEDNGKLALRYQEIQAIENAYLREEIKLLNKEIDALKKKIK
jgi:hypothetical protein